MGFNKKKGISAAAVIILLAIFSLVTFSLPVAHGITFWIGFSFAILSGVLFCACLLFLFDSGHDSRTFLRLPAAKIGWGYFIIQILVSVWQIMSPSIPHLAALIADCCLTAFFIVAVLASQAAGEAVEGQDAHTEEKVLFLKNMQSILSAIKTDDPHLAQKIEMLREDFRFSDPMSHSMLSEIEKQIESKVIALKSLAGDPANASKEVDCISDLLKERNQKCKMLKNVREEDAPKDNSGVRYVAVTISLLGILGAFALAVCFVVVPNNRYKEAMALYEQGQYEEAISAFEKLGTYKDSQEQIKAIQDAVCEDRYVLAEKYFNEQNYPEAMELYQDLGDYKDSREKIEQIQNRLETKDVIYFGSYENKPVGWRILESNNDRMLLIANDPICELPYHEEIQNVKWIESSLCVWLNEEFINSFSADQFRAILTTSVDGAECRVFLLSEEEAEDLEDPSVLEGGQDWWLRTKAGMNAVYVTEYGEIVTEGDSVVRAKGVRPCIWIDLTEEGVSNGLQM